MALRVTILEPVKEVPWAFDDKQTGEHREGVNFVHAARYRWGENSALGVVKVPSLSAGWAPGEYDLDMDSFEVDRGSLTMRKFAVLRPVSAGK